jgi:phage terminase large subunit
VGVAERHVTIPYRPRLLQQVLHSALETHRFAVAVCHRRFGKTVLAVNHLIKQALLCDKPRPRFAYIAPFRNQAKDIAWAYLKHYSQPVLANTPNESELRVDLVGGAQIRIYGADNEEGLRGIYLDGVVLDEYGLMSDTIWGEVLRPLLSDRRGWAFFIGTPNGRNQFYEIVQIAQQEPGWFFASYKASETGILPDDELSSNRRVLTEDQYQQEYECSFEASVKGAVYARELQAAREQGRIASVPYNPGLPVDTSWDIGFGDATAIWFSQSSPSGEVRLIDYYENAGYALAHYAGVLKERGYVYGQHYGPHDLHQHEYALGTTRFRYAQDLKLYFDAQPHATPVADGINAVRMMFPVCWFDKDKTQKGLDALQHYRWRPETSNPTSPEKPVHDWASHGADAFRLLAVRQYTPRMRDVEKFRSRHLLDAARAVAARERVVGPTGETLVEAQTRIARENRGYRDRDPMDKQPVGGGRRGGW